MRDHHHRPEGDVKMAHIDTADSQDEEKAEKLTQFDAESRTAGGLVCVCWVFFIGNSPL